MKHFHHWRWSFRASARSKPLRAVASPSHGESRERTVGDDFDADFRPTEQPDEFVDTLPRVFRSEPFA